MSVHCVRGTFLPTGFDDVSLFGSVSFFHRVVVNYYKYAVKDRKYIHVYFRKDV